MKSRLLILALASTAFSTFGCARDTSVYPETANGFVDPISVGDPATLPKGFFNQSVNHAVVEFQPDGTTATSVSVSFRTTSGSNPMGAFNGTGVGNRAIVGIGSWHSRPVSQAEPITFDARHYAGTEKIGVTLQIDLKCDGSQIAVVHASGASIAAQPAISQADTFARFTASISAPIWLASTAPILDPDTSMILVPTTGGPVSLQAMLTKFSSACLENGSTGANELPKGIPTAAINWSLGTDSTIDTNSTFVRRFSIGSQVIEGFDQ